MANYYASIYPSYQRDGSVSPTALLWSKFPHGSEEPLTAPPMGTTGNHRNADAVQQDTTHPSPHTDTSATTSPSSLFASTDVPDALLPDSPDTVHSSPNQARKPRRDKQRIELAPNQPPTTQGRPRARVFVACVQWYVGHSSRRYLGRALNFLPVGDARSVATARSQCATTALSVKGMDSVVTMLCRSVVDPTGYRERALVVRSRTMMKRPQGAGAAVLPQSNKWLAVGPIAFHGHASPRRDQRLISWKIRSYLSVDSKMADPLMY